MRMVKPRVYKQIWCWDVIDHKDVWRLVHNACVDGEMDNGRLTWTFDEADEDALYMAFKDENGKLYLSRQ